MYPMWRLTQNKAWTRIIKTKKGNMRIPRSGDRHKSWRYLKFLDFIRARDRYICQKCGCSDDKKLHVHHIIPYRDRPDLALDPNNVILLCIDCEEKEHQRYEASKVTVSKRVKSY